MISSKQITFKTNKSYYSLYILLLLILIEKNNKSQIEELNFFIRLSLCHFLSPLHGKESYKD